MLWDNNFTVLLALQNVTNNGSDKITATGELTEFKIILTDLVRQADYFNCVDMKHDRHGRKSLCLWGPCFCCWGTPSFLVLQGTRSLMTYSPNHFCHKHTHTHTLLHTRAFWDFLEKYGTFSLAPWASGQFLAFMGFSGGGEQAKGWLWNCGKIYVSLIVCFSVSLRLFSLCWHLCLHLTCCNRIIS